MFQPIVDSAINPSGGTNGSSNDLSSVQSHSRHLSKHVKSAAIHQKQRQKTRRAISSSLVFSDFVALIISFVSGHLIVYGFERFQNTMIILSVCIPMVFLFGLNSVSYSAKVGVHTRKSIYRGVTSVLLFFFTFALLAFIFKIGIQFSRAQLLIGITSSIGLVSLFRYVIARYYALTASHYLFSDLHIFADNLKPKNTKLLSLDATKAGVAPNITDPAAVNRLSLAANGMDSIIVHCGTETREKWAQVLKTLDVPSEIVIPELDVLNPLEIRVRDGHTSIVLTDGRLSWEQEFLKRVFDLAIVIPALPLVLPLFFVVALAIIMDSRGPVFFRQQRIGIGNRSFRIWKFRSMKSDLADATASKLTERNDPRVTRVGAFIRRTSIDELPQIFNVLVGQMSLVGPRPHAPLAKAGPLLYWEVDHTYWERHVVKPGITGLAQVRGFRGNTFAEGHLQDRLDSDLEYVANWSLLLDAKILISTVAMPFSKNAF